MSDESQLEETGNTNLLAWVIVFVFVLWIAGLFLPFWWFGNWEKAGLSGDMFGSVNALFSGLAVVGLVYTLWQQREELMLQRKEMRQMREQYQRSAEAQEGSEEVLRQQVEVNLLAARIEGLKTIIEVYIASSTHGITLSLPQPIRDYSCEHALEQILGCLDQAAILKNGGL